MNRLAIEDHCFVQINRNYLEALQLRKTMLDPRRAQNLDYILKEIDSGSTRLHEHFFSTIPGEYTSGILEVADSEEDNFLRISGIKNAGNTKPTTEQEVHDGYFDWVIVSFFDKLQGAIIKTTNYHDELMANTDIDKVPLIYFKPPYQAIYFQFNDGVPFNDKELNIDGHIVGAYMFSRIVDNKLSMQTMLIRKDHKTNDQMHYASDIKQIDMNEPDGIISCADDLHALKMSNTDLENTLNNVYVLMFKTILYMSLKDARIHEVKERDEYTKRLMSVKAKKAKKVAAKVNHKYNYILVGADDTNQEQLKVTIGDGRVMPVHWRRGHLRNQKYGQQLKDSRLVWIQPTLINQKLVTDSEHIKPKNYVVSGNQKK